MLPIQSWLLSDPSFFGCMKPQHPLNSVTRLWPSPCAKSMKQASEHGGSCPCVVLAQASSPAVTSYGPQHLSICLSLCLKFCLKLFNKQDNEDQGVLVVPYSSQPCSGSGIYFLLLLACPWDQANQCCLFMFMSGLLSVLLGTPVTCREAPTYMGAG